MRSFIQRVWLWYDDARHTHTHTNRTIGIHVIGASKWQINIINNLVIALDRRTIYMIFHCVTSGWTLMNNLYDINGARKRNVCLFVRDRYVSLIEIFLQTLNSWFMRHGRMGKQEKEIEYVFTCITLADAYPAKSRFSVRFCMRRDIRSIYILYYFFWMMVWNAERICEINSIQFIASGSGTQFHFDLNSMPGNFKHAPVFAIALHISQSVTCARNTHSVCSGDGSSPS